MSSRKIVIHGWYGNGNLGDEIILDAMLRDLRRAFPKASFTVITSDPDETERRHGVKSVGDGGTLKQRLRRFRAIAGADLFILGGGGILGSYGESDRALLAWLSPLRLAQELGVPTMTFGVGVGDRLSPREERALKSALRETDAICLRDRRSVDRLGRVGLNEKVVLTADPALLFPEDAPLHGRPRDGAPQKVSVFVRHWYVSADKVEDEARWKEFRGELAACLDALVSRSAEVSFIPMRVKDPVDDDREVAKEIVGAMAQGRGVTCVDHLMSSAELIEAISRSDLVVGMRLHSLILAAALGVPLMAIDYHPKVRSFIESLGIPEWSFEIGGEDGSRLVEAAEKALSGGFPSETVRSRLEEAKGLARGNIEIAARLMNDATLRRGRGSRAARELSVVASRLSKRGGGRDAG